MLAGPSLILYGTTLSLAALKMANREFSNHHTSNLKIFSKIKDHLQHPPPLSVNILTTERMPVCFLSLSNRPQLASNFCSLVLFSPMKIKLTLSQMIALVMLSCVICFSYFNEVISLLISYLYSNVTLIKSSPRLDEFSPTQFGYPSKCSRDVLFHLNHFIICHLQQG